MHEMCHVELFIILVFASTVEAFSCTAGKDASCGSDDEIGFLQVSINNVAFDAVEEGAQSTSSTRDTFAAASGATDVKCEPFRVDKRYTHFREVFKQRVRASQKKSKETQFLNTALLQEGHVSQTGLWLKFGVDMTCISKCNKIGPLAQFRQFSYDNETNIYGFDWFKGLPEPWKKYAKGRFNRTGAVPSPPAGVQWVVGLYNESLPAFMANHSNQKVTYLLIDSDLYSSAKYVLDTVDHALSEDAIIYFDEIMNYPGHECGELRALYEYLNETGQDYDLVMSAANYGLRGREDQYTQQVALRLRQL